MVHVQLSIALKQPELQLDERESLMLAKASANVSRWYVAIDMEKDTKSAAWLALFICMLFVYGPRGMVIARQRAERVAMQKAGLHPVSSEPSADTLQ